MRIIVTEKLIDVNSNNLLMSTFDACPKLLYLTLILTCDRECDCLTNVTGLTVVAHR